MAICDRQIGMIALTLLRQSAVQRGQAAAYALGGPGALHGYLQSNYTDYRQGCQQTQTIGRAGPPSSGALEAVLHRLASSASA